MFLEKGKRALAHSIREKRDTKKVFLLCILHAVLQEFAAHPLAAEMPRNDEIFKENHEPPFSSTDGKQQIYHPNDFVRTAQNEDSPPARLFQNQPKTTHLVVVVRPKIRFLPKKLHEQLCKQRKILDGSRLDAHQFMHRSNNHYKRLIFLKVNFLIFAPCGLQAEARRIDTWQSIDAVAEDRALRGRPSSTDAALPTAGAPSWIMRARIRVNCLIRVGMTQKTTRP